MNTYILKEKEEVNQSVSIAELGRKLALTKLLIQAFIKTPEDLNVHGDLIHERLRLQREIDSILNPLPNVSGECISPDWEEIGKTGGGSSYSQNLQLELDLIRRGKGSIKVSKPKKGTSKISISEVLERAGIVLRGGFIICPFHQERNPSMKIYLKTNTCYCFGCGKFATAEELAKVLGVKP